MFLRPFILVLFSSTLSLLFAFIPLNRFTHVSQRLMKKCETFPLSTYFIIKHESPFTSWMVLDDSEKMLEAASRLRREAEEMEESMREKQYSSKRFSTDDNSVARLETLAPSFCTSLNDSSWTISYRFASDAVSKGKDDDNVKVTYYSGKLNIQLTGDGYTHIIEDNDGITNPSSQIEFKKIWGWDEEISKEDDHVYLIFSADVMFTKSDPNYTSKPTRYYFQAKVNKDLNSGEISLVDGTVTLKKDVEPPGGNWGVFNGGGILAQFRYCGDFLMKPL